MVARRIESGSKGPKKVIQLPAKKKRSENFSLYIYKVLKQTAGNKESKGINKRAMSIVNSMIFDILDKLTQQSAQLVRYTNKRTLGYKEIEAAVKLLFPQDLAQHAIQDGRKAVDRFLADN